MFEEAAALQPADRESFLAGTCGDDAPLRRNVTELLRAHDAAEKGSDVRPGGADAFVAPLLGVGALEAAAAPAPAVDARVGSTIGRYRVIARLGEGGMGVVYEAEQENPRRRVALKLVRLARTDDPLGARLFEREVASLGRLRHAGIATIHEAGATADGVPYFAMERVHGTALDAHLRGGRPRVEGEPRVPPAMDRREQHARLALFLEVCDAIAYAHQRGVLHRDLKPSNLLVLAPEPGEEPSGARTTGGRSSLGRTRIKVLDFGLARITDPESTLASMRSDTGAIQGTLAYMSPEQARGDADAIDVRSDVYSLGVVLFEMLTGRLPVDVRAGAVPDTLRRIVEQPATVASSLVPSLRGDLDTVLGKALAKERGERYASVEAFAEDVRRVLDDVPIRARRPSAAALLRSFVRRHRAVSALAGALLLAIVGFGATMTVLYSRAVRAEHTARLEARKARRVSDFMAELFRVPDPSVSRGDTLTARRVLDEGARRIDAELASEPEVRASLLQAMGRSYLGLGLYDPADELFARADRIVAERSGPRSEQRAESRVRMAEARYQRGQFGEADSLLDEADRIVDALRPPSEARRMEIADVRAALRMDQGRFAESESLKALVLASRRRREGVRAPETLRAMSNLASSMLSLAKYAEAADTLEEVLRLREEILGPEHPDIVTTLNELAYANRRLDRFGRAESLFVRGLAVSERVLGPEHPDNAYLWNNLGLTRRQMKRWAEAEVALRRAVAIREKALPPDHPLLAWTLDNLALVLTQSGKLGEAERTIDRAIAIASKSVPADHIDRAYLQNNLATLREAQGRLREAKALRIATIPVYEKTFGPESPGLATTLGDLSLTLERLGEIREAIRHRERQVAMVEKRRGPDHPATREAREALARLRAAAGP